MIGRTETMNTTKVTDFVVGDDITLIRYPQWGGRASLIEGGKVTRITKTRLITERIITRGETEEVITDRWTVNKWGEIRSREGRDYYQEPHFYKSTDPEVAAVKERNGVLEVRNDARSAAELFSHMRFASVEDIDHLISKLGELRVAVAKEGSVDNV
jgi:hypothetical protein